MTPNAAGHLCLTAGAAVLAVAVSPLGCATDQGGTEGLDSDGKLDGWAGSDDGLGRAPEQGIEWEQVDGWSDEELDIYFVPLTNIEDRIADEVASAQHEIRIAMYNLRSERLGRLLLERQRAGVSVEVLWDARQMAKPHNTLDDDLIADGLNVAPILNDSSDYSTLHDKLAVIDGQVVFMGSANWGQSALHDNNETVMVFRSPFLAQVVDQELDEILEGRKVGRQGDVASRVQLHFSPEDRLDRVIEAAIDSAEERIFVAVFSLRLDWLGDALIEAAERGVEVSVITDRNQSQSAWVDEELTAAGIPVIEASNTASQYTAMHQKFMVVDGHTTLTGSYNWTYTATFHSYEDLAVIADDTEVAAAFEAEFGRLWERYAEEQDNPVTSRIQAQVEAYCDGTEWGENVVLVGSSPELGSWDPQAGVVLSGDGWPSWQARLELRAGSLMEYKLVILGPDGQVQWEAGENRIALLQSDPAESPALLRHEFRWE